MSDKAREFWIYQLATDHITEHFPDVEKWKKSFVEDDLLHHPEIIHVIEHSAYAALKQECEGLRNALREFDDDENWILESQHIDRKTKTGNTDYVYVGKWDPRVFASHAIKGEFLGRTPENERRKPSEFYNPDKQQTIAFQLKQNQIDELKRELEKAKQHDLTIAVMAKDIEQIEKLKAEAAEWKKNETQ